VSKKPIKSGLRRFDVMKEEDIDYSDIPEFDQAFLDSVGAKVPPLKKAIALRLDADVLEWMKAQGKCYQSRNNVVLRAYCEAHRDHPR